MKEGIGTYLYILPPKHRYILKTENTLRPSDLAREHGISTQAVRNYERDGFLPPAERTRSGYRVYTELHATALRAFLALVPAYGHSAAGRIMYALNTGDLDHALRIIDHGHRQLQRDRDTLDAVRKAITHLTTEADAASPRPVVLGTRAIGELAHRLNVTPTTLRKWEEAGILAPAREPITGYRVYRASDVRDAELTHLLRRGGYPLAHISTVIHRIREAGGTAALAGALDGWQRRLTERGRAMLTAAARLDRYLDILDITASPPP
ncbi:TioE family transcriptional regulator [Nocardia paucivorans]|uniref:TioE family transcriptional regulator n=1 Tax=Nocardia paucivorans TaxID=114259 RepID=UPI0002D3318F